MRMNPNFKDREFYFQGQSQAKKTNPIKKPHKLIEKYNFYLNFTIISNTSIN